MLERPKAEALGYLEAKATAKTRALPKGSEACSSLEAKMLRRRVEEVPETRMDVRMADYSFAFRV